eukprot:1374922-Rhodomonas_salina.1
MKKVAEAIDACFNDKAIFTTQVRTKLPRLRHIPHRTKTTQIAPKTTQIAPHPTRHSAQNNPDGPHNPRIHNRRSIMLTGWRSGGAGAGGGAPAALGPEPPPDPLHAHRPSLPQALPGPHRLCQPPFRFPPEFFVLSHT